MIPEWVYRLMVEDRERCMINHLEKRNYIDEEEIKENTLSDISEKD